MLGSCNTSCYKYRTKVVGLDQGASMNDGARVQEYQESKIEDEPILGTVLAMPDGRFQPLTWLERVLVMLRLTNAKLLEARYFKPANS